ncbi:MAG: CerR family C-terminal domain-containing protein [Chthoniobacterales bacterium]
MKPASSTLPPSATSKGDLAKTRLLEAALKVFAEKNLEGASVREIAKEAGQNVASIFYYFESKENLYLTLLRGGIHEIRKGIEEIISDLQQKKKSLSYTPQEAVEILKRAFRTALVDKMANPKFDAIRRLIAREQMEPTPAFEVIYEEGLREMHESVTRLVGIALDVDPKAPETILRTYTFFGQVLIFGIARATILRRLGWKNLDNKRTEMITRIIDENIDILCRELRKSKTHK